ncbi:MAG: hypothetical protein ABI142_06690, partial [Bryocella sp.]
WLNYGTAAALLAPAPFASSTNLDQLRSEMRQYAPSALAAGVSSGSPLTIKGTDGKVWTITALGTDSTPDGKTLRLLMHYVVPAGSDSQSADMAALRALLEVHPELRQAYGAVLVFGDIAGQNPSVLSVSMADVPA